MKAYLTLLAIILTSAVIGQPTCNELYYKKFSKTELVDDVDFIREKIDNAHINPYNAISKKAFEEKIKEIKQSLWDGMTQRDFYFAAAPLFVLLNDEHSSLSDYCVTDSIKQNFRVFPLRFQYEDSKIILTENYSPHDLAMGDELLSLNGIMAADLAENCAQLVFGLPEERKPIAIEKLWLYLPKFCYFIEDNYLLQFRSGKKVLVKSQSWDEFNKNYIKKNPVKKDYPIIKYEKLGNTGYLTINSFSTKGKLSQEVWDTKFDSVFNLINNDKVKRLFIDVSNNGGGNSAIGDKLISYFSNKPYKSYSGKWKKSAEYAAYMKQHNFTDDMYDKMPDGTVMEMPQEKIIPYKNKNRFRGSTYIVVGKNTFSSAIMFAATVQDNKLATLIGETPQKGHPDHYGETIVFCTPNTQLNFTFGVKEWVRPAGKKAVNKLIPDIIYELKDKSPAQIIEAVK